jgi:hypothetical protein
MARALPGHVIMGARIAQRGLLKPLPVAGVVLTTLGYLTQRQQFRLTAFPITVAAASDFGSAKLCDLPDTNFILHGIVVDLTSTMTGFTSNAGSAVDLALGTVATASTGFSNAGEDDLLQKLDGAGASSPGTVKGASDATVANQFLAAAARSLFVNIADPVTAATGTVTLSGTIELIYGLLGKPS